MRKGIRKVLVLLLALSMMFTSMGLPAYAAETDGGESDTRIVFSGDNVGFYKEDGVSSFGMLSLQAGSRTVLDGDTVKIYDIPSNKTVYDGLHWGHITDAELTKDVHALDNGCWQFEVSADNCGYGIPVAPVKTEERGGGTTSSQYYLCIPAKDKLPVIADYSGVKEALAKVPEDLSGYTEESAKAVTDAVAVTEAADFYYMNTTEQATVDAAAAAINDAVGALEEVKPAEPEQIELVPTNEELMFKVVNAYIEKNGDKAELVFALSGSGYEDVIAGTYDDAMDAQVGASHDNWIHGAKADVNCDYWTDRAIDNPPVNHYEEGVQNKWQFRVPVELPESGTVKVPVVAVSKSRYQKAEKADAENPDYSAAFTSRQFVIDVDAKTVRTGNLKDTFDVAVKSNVETFAVSESGSVYTVGTPTANEYTCQPTITMNDKVYDKAFLGTKEEAAAEGAKTIEMGEDNSFVLGFFNTLGGKQHVKDGKAVAAFHVAADAPYAEKDTWVERTFTIDLENKTITIDGDELTAETVEPETIELVPTNEELMFKVVNAYIEKNGDKTELVFALSGSGYEDVIAGTYDDAMAAQVGASHDNWIHGAKADVNCDYWTDRAIDNPPVNHYEEGVQNKWQFRVPVELPASGTVKVPVVAVSKSRYQKAEKADAENPDYSSAFTSRQFVIDVDVKTVRTGNLSETFDVTVASNVKSFAVVETGSLHTVGTPTANEYTCQPTITMNDKVYDKAFLGTKEEAAADGAKTIELGEDQSFVLGFFNTLGGKQHIVDGKAVAAFHVAADAPYAEKDTWVERTFTIDLENKTITIDGDELTEETPDELKDGTYTASKVSTDVTTEASGMIMVTKATVVVKDGQATAIVTMKGTGADRFYVSDTATADTIIAEAVAEEQKEVNGEFAGLLGGLKMEGESAYTFWPVPIKLGEPKVYAARSASHFEKQDKAPEEYYYVHDFQIDAEDLVKVSDSTDLPITEQQEAQRYLNQYFMDGKVVTADTAASVKGKDAKVTIPYYDKENNKISSVIFKMAESDKFRSGWFVDSSILNTTYFSSSNLKKIRYPEGASGKVTFNPKAAYRDEGMTFTATLKLYPADAEYDQYDADGVYYDKEPLAEQTFTFTVEPLPGDRHVTIDVIDAVSKEPIEGASVTVTKDADGSAVEAADGTYALTVPGTYTIKASAEGYLVPGSEETEYVQTEYAPKKDGEKVTISLIKAEQSKNTITFDLKDQMGDAVVNPAITVYPWNDKEAVVAPEADGSYKLYNGTNYGYTVKAEGYEDKTGTIKPSEDATVDVVVNKYLSEQKFTFRVYDSKTNETIDNVNLTVKYGPSGEDESTYTEAQPDKNGVYTIPIDNRVVAYGQAVGYEDSSLGVWSLGFDPLKECSFGLKAMYPVLAVDKTSAGMMKPAAQAFLTGDSTVMLPMLNDSFSAVFVGDGRNVEADKTIALADDNTFTFDVAAFDQEMTIAFQSKKNGNWLNKKVTVSKDNASLVIVDDKADYTKVEEAKAQIPEDLSIYTAESRQAVEDAVAAVKTGKNSVEQAAVDAMADAINEAVAGLVPLKDISGAEVTGVTDKTYNGSARTHTIKVFVDGQQLDKKAGDYTVKYENNVNAGEAKVTITGTGAYTGTVEKTFQILPKKITPALTLSSASLVYNGSNRSPGLTVKDGSTKLVKGTDYTVKMAAKHASVGKWTITVNPVDGSNYTFAATKTTFKIVPKATTLKSVTAQSKAFKVTWNKADMPSSEVTGYQIQWSTYKNFAKDNHTKMVTGYNSTSFTINSSVWKSIKGGQKYYVRICTYKKTSSGTYKSSWSKAKTVTTNK